MNLVDGIRKVIGGVWVRRASRVILHSGDNSEVLELYEQYKRVRDLTAMGRIPRSFRSFPDWKEAIVPKHRGGVPVGDHVWEVTQNTTWIRALPGDEEWYGDLKKILTEDKNTLRIVDLGHIPMDVLVGGMCGIPAGTVSSFLSGALRTMAQELVRLGRNEGQRTIFIIHGEVGFLNQLKTEIDREWVDMAEVTI